MKMSNLTIVFLVIAVVILIVLTSYISLQIDTINKQNEYNSKLIDSTKQAIDAFEINTVEWNSSYSGVQDSKRRDVMASINTFTSSFANNIGVGGTSKEFILSYMPAIAYTLYDGFYIYTPEKTKQTIMDSNGVRVMMTDKLYYSKDSEGHYVIQGNIRSFYEHNEDNYNGKILYVPATGQTPDGTYYGTPFTLNSSKAAETTEYKHILKPFAAYSENAETDLGTAVINYTLDNYVSVYLNQEDKKDSTKTNFVSRSGYLTNLKKIQFKNNNWTKKSIEKIEFNDIEVKGEHLKEKINYLDADISTIGTFPYVYDADQKIKIYFEDESGNNPFFLDSDLNKVYVGTDTYSTYYKKCIIPTTLSGEKQKIERFQNLSNGLWYYIDSNGEYVEVENSQISGYGIDPNDKTIDYSAINYCVESYVFTSWFNNLNLKVYKIDEDGNFTTETDSKPLNINNNNNPDPEAENSQDSAFYNHKREVIKNVLNSSLNQAITSYSGRKAGEYKLPKLTETDWDQVLRNVSIISFVQNIPIGLKYYNNYAIATSTVNKEFVDPNEIYLYSQTSDSDEYHRAFCQKLESSDISLIGYRSIDFIEKTYIDTLETDPNKKSKNYFKHEKNIGGSNINVNQECYYCLVQRSLYEPAKTANKETAYYTALARERYIAKEEKGPDQNACAVDIIAEAVDLSSSVFSGNVYVNGELGNPSKTVTIPNYTVSDGEKTYEIKGDYNSISTEESVPITNPIASTDHDIIKNYKLSTTKNTTTNVEPDKILAVTTGGWKTTIKINKPNDNQVVFNWETKDGTDDDLKNRVKIGGTTQTDSGMKTFSTDGDLSIKVEVPYKKNYVIESGKIEHVWANINKYNSLTIVTIIENVTGQVRLGFYDNNNNLKLYSQKTFKIADGVSKAVICCEIEGTDWYNYDWKVGLLDTNNSQISIGTKAVEYYTIYDKTGLKGFAKATNQNPGALTKIGENQRSFYILNDIDMQNDEMYPICGKGNYNNAIDETNNRNEVKWFQGIFQGYNGTQYEIKNVKIKSLSDTNAFGLFGRLDSSAQVKDIKINKITIDLASKNYVGGLAGYNETSKLDNIEIIDPNIIGRNCVGGLIGYNRLGLHGDKVRVTKSGGIAEIANIDTMSASDESNITVKIKGSGSVGGYIGRNNAAGNEAEIIDLTNEIPVIGNSYVGGIVGYSEVSNITNCHNKATVKGYAKEIGGIVGRFTSNANTVKVYIKECSNTGKITNTIKDKEGRNKTNASRGYTGGIVGCIGGEEDSKGLANYYNRNKDKEDNPYSAQILYCYNAGTITSHVWTGGIVGGFYYSNILGCYNKGTLTTGTSDEMDRYSGGIAGGEQSTFCYSQITYCYDCTPKGKRTQRSSNGIIGYRGEGATAKNIGSNNYYNSEGWADTGNKDGITNANFKGLNANELKRQLYNWANSGPQNASNKYIYNTIAALETGTSARGFEGFGVLYWEIPNYVKLTTNMFICNQVNGIETFEKIPNMAFEPCVKLNGNSLQFNSLPVTEESAITRPVSSTGVHRWIMMVPKGVYNIKGETKYTSASNPNAKIYIYDSHGNKKIDVENSGQDYNIQEATTIYVAPILKTIQAELTPKRIEVKWDTQDQEIEFIDAFHAYYDADGEEIRKAAGYYDLDPNDSKVITNTLNKVEIKLDKYDELTTTKRQPVKFKNNIRYWSEREEIYHTAYWGIIPYKVHDGWKVSGSPQTIQAGTEAINVFGRLDIGGRYGNGYQSSCKVYVDLGNLREKVFNSANYELQVAEIKMDCEAKIWKAVRTARTGQLTVTIYITKNGAKIGGDLWKITSDSFEASTKKWTHWGNEYEVLDSEELLSGQTLSGSLEGSTNEDNFGIVVELLYKCPSGDAYFSMENIELAVQYDPKT
ncbi:MAG: hypothetical protein J5507_02265 [Clostridia bacterium]|nr:hypothetical protein [Clostridia bacterium]